MRGPAGHPEEQRREKPEICRGFTRRSSPRPAVRPGREALRPSPRPAPGSCPPIRKRLWSGCVSSRYTRPQAKRGEEICRVASCILILGEESAIISMLFIQQNTPVCRNGRRGGLKIPCANNTCGFDPHHRHRKTGQEAALSGPFDFTGSKAPPPCVWLCETDFSSRVLSGRGKPFYRKARDSCSMKTAYLWY